MFLIYYRRCDLNFISSITRLTIDQLLMFCKQFEAIPYEGHKYLTGQCYYGGRVTDPNDRKLLLTLLNHVYKGESFGSGIHLFKIPDEPTKENTLKYISNLPLDAPPELFGFHPNANVRKSVRETNNLVTGTMHTQAELLARFRQQNELQSNGSGLLSKCEAILGKIPEQISTKGVLDNFPLSAANSLNTVLFNETLKYNEIWKYISDSLLDLTRALKGEVSSTRELEEMQDYMARQKVPAKWIRNSFNSKKPLSSFLQDLIERFKFFKSWIEDGEPTTMWISAFLCPQSLFAAIQWNCSRNLKVPLNEIVLTIGPTEFESKSRQTSLQYSDFCRVRQGERRLN